MKSWQTTFLGAVLAVCGAAIVIKDPSKISDPVVVGMLVTSLGLIRAADDSKLK